MIGYTQQELVGATELAKSLGGFLDKVVKGSVEKLAIVRRNKPEAVIVPIAEYERMKRIADEVEYHEIADIIEERLGNAKPEDFVPLEDYMESRKARGLYVPN